MTATRAPATGAVGQASPASEQMFSARFCVLLGLGFYPLMFTGLAIAGLLPLPSPADTAQTTAHFFRHNLTDIRVGLVIASFGAALMMPLLGAVGAQIRRLDGPASTFATIWTIGTTIDVAGTVLPLFTLQAAALRTGRSAEAIQTLSDLAWIPWVAASQIFVVQLIVFTAAIVRDSRPRPLFPRWVVYLNAATAVAFAMGGFSGVTQTGPFRWNGVFGFWTEAVGFVPWMAVMAVFIVRDPNGRFQSDAADRTS